MATFEAFMLASMLWLVAKLVGLLIMVEVVSVETHVLASILLVVLVLVVVVVVEAYVLAAVLDWLLLFRPTNDEAAELHKEIKVTVTIRWLGGIFFQQVSSRLCTLKILFLRLCFFRTLTDSC